MRLVFATTNKGKLAELRALVGDAFEVVSLGDLPPVEEAIEDGATFEENAVKKAVHYARATGLHALADDSGLAVDFLDGAPGVHSARYAPGDDRARYEKLLSVMSGVPKEKRGAAFLCALALASPKGQVLATESGACRGEIAEAPSGTGGFGYDPVFFVPSHGVAMAELTREQKSAISHRGEAFRKMKGHLLAIGS